MEVMRRWRMRLISSGLVMALVAPPLALAGDDNSKAAAPALTASTTDTSMSSTDALPESPGSTQSDGSQSPAATATPAPAQQAPPPPAAQAKTHEPVGTAAAAVGRPLGVAAANPVGSAIAPAKQKRTRMLVIKVGTILAAGVAIGTVAALSKGSPSRPPGSH